MKKLLLVLSVSVLAFSCTKKSDDASKVDSTIKVEEITYQKSSTPVIREEGDTVVSTVDISYIKLSGGDEAVNAKINKFLADIPLSGLSGYINMEDSTAAKYPDLDKATAAFLAEPEKQKKEFPDMMLMSYSYESKVDTLFISPKVISVYAYEYTFTGGAHGNYGTDYYNFDAKTGDLLKLGDFVKDTVALTKLVEQKFIENEKAEAKANNEEFDMSYYFLNDGKFFLPASIGFTKDGLRFTYSPYEIAAYARGEISFDISYKELAAMLNDKYKP